MPNRYHYKTLLTQIDILQRASKSALSANLAALTAVAMGFAPVAFAASDSPESPTVTRSQVYVPRRPPAALFEGAPARQDTEIHYEPDTQMVAIKMFVQDPQGYFIPNIRRDNFVVFEDDRQQRNASVEIERSPVTVAVLACMPRTR